MSISQAFLPVDYGDFVGFFQEGIYVRLVGNIVVV